MTGPRRDHLVDLGLSAVIAVVVLGPLLSTRGFALHGDMVLVPHQPWKDAWLALDGSTPRFVPGDAVLWALTWQVPGDLVQKVLLLGALLLGGVGAGRMVGEFRTPGRAAAIVLFLWNPWVLERLSIGQWGSLLGYAALPWVVRAAASFRDGPRARWPSLVLWLAFTALWSPASAMAGALTAFCVVVAARRLVPGLAVLAFAVVVNLPWLVPSFVAGGRIDSPGEQFEAFAARAESGAGLLASVGSLGGIWKASVVPPERTVALVVLLSCVSTLLALAALWRTRRTTDATVRTTRLGLLGLALAVVGLTVLPAVPFLTDAFDAAADRVTAVAALRDGHRFLGPAVLVLLPGIAVVADRVWAAARTGREALRAVAVLVVLLPALCLPSMAWGLGGELRAVTYPAEWFRAAQVVEDDLEERGGSTVVLPWTGTYRGFDWNDSRAQLDPAPRFFAGEVLIDDRIYLDEDTVLANEDDRLAAVTDALASGDPTAELAALGVGRVLVEKGNGVAADEVPPGRVLHDGRGLTVVAIEDPAAGDPGAGRHRNLVIAGDLVAGLVAGLACLAAVACVLRRRPVW